MNDSVYNDILNAVKLNVDDLGLQFNSENVPSDIRKLPVKEEVIDTLPLICISPHQQPEKVTQLSFEPLDCGVQVEYMVEVVLIFSGGRNFATNLPLILNFRQSVRRLFQGPPLVGLSISDGSSLVWKIQAIPEYVFDYEELNNNYDYDGLAFVFTTAEQRIN